MWWLIGATSVAALVFVVLSLKEFRNMLFYIQWMRVYWIVKDNGTASMPRCMRAFMRQTSPPWWRGKGIQLRIGKYTLQVGVLREKAVPVSVTDMEDDAGGLLAQLGGRELDVDAKTIRKEWS
jgi:hypothetical protein